MIFYTVFQKKSLAPLSFFRKDKNLKNLPSATLLLLPAQADLCYNNKVRSNFAPPLCKENSNDESTYKKPRLKKRGTIDVARHNTA